MPLNTFHLDSFTPIIVTDFMGFERSKAFSLVLPAYNEARREETLIDPLTGCRKTTQGQAFENALERYKEFFNIEFGNDWDLTVVNDGSLDNTSDITIQHEVNVIDYFDRKNRGRGFALKVGLTAVNGHCISETDADGSYAPETIMRQFEAVNSGDFDIAVAHRADTSGQHENRIRTFGHNMLHAICELPFMANTGVKDPQAGAKTFSSEAAKLIWPFVTIDGWTADQQALVIAKIAELKIADLPAEITTHEGSSVKPISDALKMLRDARSIGKNTRKLTA